MKEWKKWKKLAAALIIGSQIAGILPVYGAAETVFADEIEEESEMGMSSSESSNAYSEEEKDAENLADMELFLEEDDTSVSEEPPVDIENQPKQDDVSISEETPVNMELPLEENDTSTFTDNPIDTEVPLNQEEGIAAQQEVSLDLSSDSFQISDIRDSSKVSAFNGADGKQAVIVFGGIKTCANTTAVLSALTEIVSMADMSQLNIYVFDIQETSKEDILAQLGHVSEQIIVNSIGNYGSEYYNFWIKCYQATVGAGSFIMPLVAYKGADGVLYEYTTGLTNLDTIVENVNKGGLDIGISAEKQVLNVTGQAVYDEAYKVLDILNQERANVGLGALTMDEELLEAAMLRAAECSLYYSHTRPNGKECFTASGRMHGENIAMLQTSADEVMNSWMNSEGHRNNILGDSYHSVGIGCFYFNGIYAWTQCFGMGEGTTGDKKSNQSATYAVTAATHLVVPELVESSGTLKVGETKQLQIGATQLNQSWCFTYIDADSYDWESDSAAAIVSSDGVITALSTGKAVISGKNKANSSEVLTYTLTISDNQSDIKFGDSNGDGKIDSKDAVMMKRYMAGYTDQNINLAASDVNADGVVDSRDVVKVLKKLAGYNVVLGEQ